MNNWTAKLKREWENDPVRLIVVAGFAATAAAKLIEAMSGAQSRRAYARNMNYRVDNKR